MNQPDRQLDVGRQQDCLRAIALVNSLVASETLEDIESLTATMDLALVVGPVIYPTEWIQGHEQTASILKLLRPLAAYRRLVVEAKQAVSA